MRWKATITILGLAIAILPWERHVKQRSLDIALIKASFDVDAQVVEKLLRNGASPITRYGVSGPGHFASSDGGYPMAADKWTALLALANSDSASDRLPVARLLLDAGADINADDGYGTTSLGECCYMNREALALFLIDRGANPDTREGLYIDGTYNIAPVHRATNNVKVLRSLVEHGADISVRDSAGNSPLDWARQKEDSEVISILEHATKQ